MNHAPYVDGSTKLATVRTKIDNQISVVLPRIRDEDNYNEFDIEAKMRHNH